MRHTILHRTASHGQIWHVCSLLTFLWCRVRLGELRASIPRSHFAVLHKKQHVTPEIKKKKISFYHKKRVHISSLFCEEEMRVWVNLKVLFLFVCLFKYGRENQKNKKSHNNNENARSFLAPSSAINYMIGTVVIFCVFSSY